MNKEKKLRRRAMMARRREHLRPKTETFSAAVEAAQETTETVPETLSGRFEAWTPNGRDVNICTICQECQRVVSITPDGAGVSGRCKLGRCETICDESGMVYCDAYKGDPDRVAMAVASTQVAYDDLERRLIWMKRQYRLTHGGSGYHYDKSRN